ncbi:hypothetical protein [Massilia aquatica]|uniref:Uncharacterized protein n=1 Tax=Massilia aquatica TaxID=2609000 RepID=A0ABX0M7D9_9BURK|nr:hypothetical protein [Massilia aquatica]NHZ40142.1 hypothetical protein [Massilia aquatica]
MKRPILAAVLILAIGAGGALALPYVWLPTGTSTVSLWWAADTFKQCSREAPQGGEPYWLPTGQQIFDLELRLWALMRDRDARGLRAPRKFQQFQRQYIGFTRNGERLIYANVYPQDDYGWEAWTLFNKPVLICDGGNFFWGIVYNPATGKYEEPSFNGPRSPE